MKHKYTIAGVGIILIAVALIGGTMAANNAQTSQAAEADISVNGLKGGIEVSSEDPVFAKNSDVTATPGGDYDLSLNAVNAGGDLDYASYFKAVIYKEWNDANGDYIDPVESEAITEDRVRIGDTYLDEVEPGDVVNGWIVASVDEEEIVLFYTKPIEVGASTTNFIDGVAFNKNLNNDYTGASYTIEFEVTTVQTISGEAAFASSFGVFPELDENGNIVSVSEEKPATATE
ncbi:MAG: hypothetical protein II092_04050 [Lachnospiraceae bacterium]|nr:hypothetical protein [Lachnospiraceae bacterium]